MTAPTVISDCEERFLSAEAWERDYREALRLERQANETEALVLTEQSDRECLREFAEHLRRRASQIRGRLQREADREANAAEDAKRGHTEWMGGRF